MKFIKPDAINKAANGEKNNIKYFISRIKINENMRMQRKKLSVSFRAFWKTKGIIANNMKKNA